MSSANERLREVRKALGLTMAEFAPALGLKQSGISNIESGQRIVSEKHLKMLCATYPHVNAEWIMTGEGTMFIDPKASPDEIDKLCDEYGMGKFVRRMLHEYALLSDRDKAVIDRFIERAVSGEYDDEIKRAGILSDAAPAPASDFDIDAEVESYRQELIREKRAAVASGRLRDTGAAKD